MLRPRPRYQPERIQRWSVRPATYRRWQQELGPSPQPRLGSIARHASGSCRAEAGERSVSRSCTKASRTQSSPSTFRESGIASKTAWQSCVVRVARKIECTITMPPFCFVQASCITFVGPSRQNKTFNLHFVSVSIPVVCHFATRVLGLNLRGMRAELQRKAGLSCNPVV